MIFDASSIFVAIRKMKPEVLRGNTTCELAKYELGNALWKEFALHSSISLGEAEKLMDTVIRAIELMNIRSPDWSDAFKLSLKLNITFYDASYLQLAINDGTSLVTEDEKLREKAEKVVDVRSVYDLI